MTGAALGFPLGAADAAAVAAAEAVAVVATEAVGSGAAEAAFVGAAEAALATGSVGTSGVGFVPSELHAAAETEAATITARPLARRAQNGQKEPAAMCRWHRLQGTRSRISGRVTGMPRGLHSDRSPAPHLRAASLYCAAAAVLVLTRYAPSFAFLGQRGELFGWLGYVTLLTAALPGGVALLALRRRLPECGLRWGLARRDAPWIALAMAAAVALAAVVVARSPEMHDYYPRYRFVIAEPWLWLPATLAFAAYGLAWEMMFRGFLLFGAFARPGALAIAVQTALFAAAHADKPRLEAWLSLPAGVAFALAALRTRSVIPGWIVHFTLSTSVNLFAAYGGAR